MPVDQSAVGRTYPPTEPYQVGREKIREFATAIGATDPIYHDPAAARESGHPDVVAPPTFPVLFTLELGRQVTMDLGLDYNRVVHGDQRFVYNRPVTAGDELVWGSSIAEAMTRGGHDMITTRTDVTTLAGEPVVTVWAKMVVRGEA